MSITGVFVSGLSGRMGQEIQTLIDSSNTLRFCGGLNQDGPKITDENIDVVVDFSLPEAMDGVIDFCETRKLPLVSGTTGLKPENNSRLIALSRNVPVFWSANMSFGVYVMNRLVEALGPYKEKFQFQITETHHKNKKDAPSGTALQIEKTAKANSLQLENTLSLREGAAFGIHTFEASRPMETIQITHKATQRQLFADGALQVCRWILEQKPGFYDMRDFVETPASPAPQGSS